VYLQFHRVFSQGERRKLETTKNNPEKPVHPVKKSLRSSKKSDRINRIDLMEMPYPPVQLKNPFPRSKFARSRFHPGTVNPKTSNKSCLSCQKNPCTPRCKSACNNDPPLRQIGVEN
jgi:hypothetical protein